MSLTIDNSTARTTGAKQLASQLAFGQEVIVQTFGHAKYGQTIGDVTLPGGKSLNQELVREGWCWWYRKYTPGNAVLEELERRARGGLGLWADAAPIPPREWREERRESLAERNKYSWKPSLRRTGNCP